MGERNCIFQRINGLRYGYTTPFKLFDAAKNSKNFVQKLQLQKKIPAHTGCVNSICWSEAGEYLLSGSDDQHLCISHGYNHSILAYIQTGHRANIFSAKFLPSCGNSKVVSCSGDGVIIYSDVECNETSMNNKFNCHFGTAYEIMTVPNDPNTFLSCGEDGTVRWFDLRAKTSCCKDDCKEDILINCRCAVTSLAVNPLTPYQLAVGCADATVRIFDRRMLGTCATGNYMGSGIGAMMANFTVPDFTHSHRITSLSYSPNGQEMLVSYSSDYIYLFDVKDDLEKEAKMLRNSNKDSPRSNRCKSYSRRPLMKRLRVRGDWSDTGPNARPESESRGEQQPRSLHASLMQRMSDVLTSMFNARNRSRTTTTHTSSSSSQSEDSEMEGTDEDDGAEESSNHPQTAAEPSSSSVQTEAQSSCDSQNPPDTETSCVTKESEIGGTVSDNSSASKEPSCDLPSVSNVTVPCTDRASSSSGACDGSDSNRSVELQMPVDSDETEDPVTDVLNLSFQNLEQEISSRRNSLIEVHQVEPMVKLHYSGQGLNSGLITVGVSGTCRTHRKRQGQSSQESDQSNNDPEIHGSQVDNSIASTSSENNNNNVYISQKTSPTNDTVQTDNNEEKLLKESTSSVNNDDSRTIKSYVRSSSFHSSLTDILSSNETEIHSKENVHLQQTQTVTSDNEDRDLDNVQPSSTSASFGSSSSNVIYAGLSPVRDNDQDEEEQDAEEPAQEQDEEEVALMMDVDSWDSDDEPPRSQSPPTSSWRRTSSESVPVDVESVPESIMRSIDDELKMRNEEIQKEEEQMMDVPQPKIKRRFTGHRNARTMIKEATFWGDNFIMSGSDCGHIFVWDRYSAELVMLMEADHHVVNCLQPHPFDPVLASSGIDYDIKIWAPLRDEPLFDFEKASEIVKRNEIMLEETKDTITVPASFMIRMLASLNQLRSGSGSVWRRAAQQMRSRNLDRFTSTR